MISKEEFKNKDRLIKGITEDGNFRVSVVKTTNVVQTAQDRHNLSLLNTVLLGRAMTGTMLMASELKGEERVQLRLEGNGPVNYLVAEANSVGEIRGYSGNPAAQLDYADDETRLGHGLGLGVLTFKKILYNKAEPRTSTIELKKGNVTQDLAYYMVQSEQIPSAILLDVGIDEDGNVNEAGGVLIQKLPGAREKDIKRLQKKLKKFDSIHELFQEGLYIDDIMERALAPKKVRELSRLPVHFFCRCSRDRFKDALALVSYDELKEMQDEGQELVCHFCNEHYQISKAEIEEIVEEARVKLN